MTERLKEIIDAVLQESPVNRQISTAELLAALVALYTRHLPDPSPITDAQGFVSHLCDELAGDFGTDFRQAWDKVSGEYFD